MGKGVTRLKKGMRVAAIGAGYALHTNYALVPQNLCIEIPQNVSDDDASYAMLLATAMQAVRRADVSIGEYYIISGLGIVGLPSGKLLQLSGCFVAGIDQHQERVDLAKQWGFDDSYLVTDEKLDEKLDAFTCNEGFDGAVVAFGGPADQAMDTIVNHTRIQPDLHHTGTVVTVGWPKFTYDGEIGKMNNIDLRRSSRTGAGYHDAEWEVAGKDYPPVLVRWSTLRNLDEIMSQTDISASEVVYNLLYRCIEDEVLPKSKKHNVPILTYSSLMQGFLAGKYKNLSDFPANRARTRMFDNETHPQARHKESGCEREGKEALEKIWEIVYKSDYTMEELSVGWLKAQEGVGGVLVGTRNAEQSRDLKKLIDINLEKEWVDSLTEATSALKRALGSNIDMWDHRTR